MEVFVLKSLEKLRAESSRRDTDFRESADAVMRDIQENSAKPGVQHSDDDADKYFRPFQLALDVKATKFRTMALDAVEKMISFGYLRGVTKVKQDGVERLMVDIIIESICHCRDDPNEPVQLQVIKALNTAISSDKMVVKEQSLLAAIRACYHICLVSKNQVNKNSAKGTLRQMLSIIFKRMELAHEKLKLSSSSADAADAESVLKSPIDSVDGKTNENPIPPTIKRKMTRMVPVKKTITVRRLKNVAADPSAVASSASEDSRDSPSDIVVSKNVFPETMYESVWESLDIRLSPPSVEVAPPVASEPEYEEVQEEVTEQVSEEYEEEVVNPAFSAAQQAAHLNSPATTGLHSRAHHDAYLIFRALCHLTVAGDEELAEGSSGYSKGAPPRPSNSTPGGGSGAPLLSDDALLANPIALQSKLLSMDLVQGILDSCGPALRDGPKFIGAIKQYLCVGLLKNVVSTIPLISALSLKTFMALMRHFKRHIAAEIEIFLSTVFLRMLRSSSSSHEQKLNVLAAFRSICQDPAALLEMFLNYDCVDDRQNVFEDSVKVLAQLAQGRNEELGRVSSVAEAAAIRGAAISILSAIMQSLVVLSDTAAKETIASGAIDAMSSVLQTKGNSTEPLTEQEEEEAIARALSSSSSNAPTPPITNTASASLAKQYEEQRKRRTLLATAAVKFEYSPKRGVEYLQSVGLCGPEPKDIAACFFELQDTLDKTGMGDFMGEDKPLNVKVLHAYVDSIDFTGLTYDDGMRKYLQGFRIPGEAQKIDRMMEKFAERYCKCNPGVFPSADTAFVLAYSIMMLHTDAHNPNVRPDKKMSKDAFIRNNRGIADNGDLPSQFLSDIYDSIYARPFTLRDDDWLREKLARQSGAGRDEKSRRAKELEERTEIVKAGQLAMSVSRSHNSGGAASSGDIAGYFSASDVRLADHVRPIFEIVWGPLLAVFSVNFECASDHPDDSWLVNACLTALNQAIRVAGTQGLEAERDMLVSTLCKFTLLDSANTQIVREYKGKHVAAQLALLAMASAEGAVLGPSWGPVLVCISNIHRVVNTSIGGKDDSVFFSGRAAQAASAAAAGNKKEQERLRLQQEREREVERANAALVGAHVTEDMITRIFTRSTQLPSDAIVDFVTQLAAVSLQELRTVVPPPANFPTIGSRTCIPNAVVPASSPRVFSLQKVVEVADFNMDVRPRMVWAGVWDTLTRFFTSVCCSAQSQVSMFAIDSLKQLALKFLNKPELKSFHFQTKFLAPFVTLMDLAARGAGAPAGAGAGAGAIQRRMAPAPEIRELILHVCANIIRARAGNIRSGWRSFMGVYAAAAADSDELLVSLAFSMAHEVISSHFDSVVSAGAFSDAVKCMVTFGANSHTMFALRAIDHCASLGGLLARGKVPIGDEAPGVVPEEDWYDLDGPENADVLSTDVSSKEHKEVQEPSEHKEPSLSSFEHMDAIEEGNNVEMSSEAFLDEIFAQENATDAAMLATDPERGGKIRRFRDEPEHIQKWWPLLTGLASTLASDSRISVRMRALHALMALLRRFGPAFSPELWRLVYQGVLLPIFDDVRSYGEEASKESNGSAVILTEKEDEGAPHYSLNDFSQHRAPMAQPSLTATLSHSLWKKAQPSSGELEVEWLRTTCMHALSSFVRLQIRFFPRLRFLLPTLLSLIESCIAQSSEGLARIGVAAFQILLKEAGPVFSADIWDLVVNSLRKSFEATLPRALLDAREQLLPNVEALEAAADKEYLEALQAYTDRVEELSQAKKRALQEQELFGEDKPVLTPFGKARIISVRPAGSENDKALIESIVVKYPFGIGYLHPSVVRLNMPPLDESAFAPPPAPKRQAVVLPPPGRLPFHSQTVITQCVVQLELIGCCAALADAHISSLSKQHVDTLLSLLQNSAVLAVTFNGDRPLRRALWEAGFMNYARHNKLPSLLRQETSATQQLLSLLMHLYSTSSTGSGSGSRSNSVEWKDMVVSHLTELIQVVLKRYLQLSASVDRARVLVAPTYMQMALQMGQNTFSPEEDALLLGEHAKDLFRESAAYGRIVLGMLEGFLAWDKGMFLENLSWLYPLLTGLISSGSIEIRSRVSEVFEKRLVEFMPFYNSSKK